MTTLWDECGFLWREALALAGGDHRRAVALRDRALRIAETTPLTLAQAWQEVRREESRP